MADYVILQKSALDTLAQHINTKVGTTGAKTIAQMQAMVDGITGKESVEWHQCPEQVRNYLANVTYSPDNYNISQIENYLTNIPADSKPVGKIVDGVTYYNEIPNKQTPFSSTNVAGTLEPLDSLRLINGGTYGQNIRDLGGWTCDGGTVKYGMLYRGANIYPTDPYIRPILVGECGIRMELDLRGNQEEPIRDKSALGNIGYCCPETFVWYSLTNTTAWREILRCIFDSVLTTTPVYFHCSAGMDRAGTVACIIEALLGLSQNDIDKDYELSSFAGTDYLKKRNNVQWKQLIGEINALTVGSTFRDKVVNWVASLGFTAAEINAFRAAMIDGTPETVTPGIATYTITKSQTNATITGETSATQYQEYTADIVPNAGYRLSDIAVTMGGADIKGQTYVQESYPEEKGKVYIQSVTGNIVITAKADASAPTYTNLADPTSEQWKTNYRISSTAIVAQTGKTVSNPISVVKGDVIRVKGVNFVANEDRYQLSGFNSAGTDVTNRAYISVLPDAALDYTHEGDVHVFTVKYVNLASDGALCFAFTTPADPNVVIITKNEEIK
jgi:protein tyrosine/serine phosphatase